MRRRKKDRKKKREVREERIEYSSLSEKIRT